MVRMSFQLCQRTLREECCMQHSSFLFFIFLILLTSVAHALDVPTPQGYVRDDAGMLSAYENDMESQLQKLETETSVEIAVLTVSSLEGEDISSFAGRVFDTWKLGQADVDNGLLIVVSLNDRAYFFQTGYGLEGTLPDIVLGRMGREILVPYFREEEYGAGITAVVREMESYIRNDPSVVSKYEEKDPFQNSELFGAGFSLLFVVILLFLLAVVRIDQTIRKKSLPRTLTLANAFMLFFMSIWMTGFLGFVTLFIFGTFYGLTLTSIILLYFIISGNPLATTFNMTPSAGTGFGGFGRGSGGFGSGGFGGGGFGGGMSGGGGAGGKW